MPPAARVGDMHTCPMVTPAAPPVPHVGGPILPAGCPTVLIGGQPAARVGDAAACVGPPDSILAGAFTVLIGRQPAARLGDPTVHGGIITTGFPTVQIGLPRPSTVPADWVAKPSKAGGGTRYVDPANPHNSVRVMPGDTDSPHPDSQNPYVRWTRNGQALGKNGNVLPKKRSPDAHIPLDEFEYKAGA